VAEEVEFVVTDWEYQDAGTDDWWEWDLTANFRITNPTLYPAKVLYELRTFGFHTAKGWKTVLATTYGFAMGGTFDPGNTPASTLDWAKEDLVEVGAGESLVKSVNARIRIQYPEHFRVEIWKVGVVSMFGEHDYGAEPYWLDLRRQDHTYRCP
jgi:hypothetical protein